MEKGGPRNRKGSRDKWVREEELGKEEGLIPAFRVQHV